MFGNKVYKETKAKKFTSDKERKRYFAIKNYYKKKAKESSVVIKIAEKPTKKYKK